LDATIAYFSRVVEIRTLDPIFLFNQSQLSFILASRPATLSGFSVRKSRVGRVFGTAAQ
jgi:hypothetical protein